MAKKVISIDSFNLGGLSDSKWSGIEHSFYKLVGIDMHSQPGVIKSMPKLTKDSGSTITELCNHSVSSSNGEQYWFSSTSGKIWRRNAAGVWSLAYTTVPSTGGAGCLGAIEYMGYIYWATETFVHRITTTDALVSSWATLNTDWHGLVGDTEYHPMIVQQRVLYIGDNHTISEVNDGTYTAGSVDLKTPYRVSALGKFGGEILIGTTIDGNINKTKIYRWNTWSLNFSVIDEIDEVGINSFLPADNITFAQAGKSGNIYVFNGQTLELYKKIPGNYSPSNQGVVKAGSTANFAGQTLMAFTNTNGNPAESGIYRLGKNSRNYPYIMDMPFVISERDVSGNLITANVTFGAILVVGDDLYVAWEYGGVYGIDKIDYNNKLDQSYFETRVLTLYRYDFSSMYEVMLAYNDIPSGTGIEVYSSENYGAYNQLAMSNDTSRNILDGFLSNQTTSFQIKTVLRTINNDTPVVESIGVSSE